MNLKTHTFFLVLFMFSWNTQAQQMIYVSPDGNDSYSGSIHQPLKTIEKALDAAGTGHTEIVLKGGIYYLDNTLELNQTKQESLTIRAAAGAAVTISGGKELDLSWTAWKDGIYTASIPEGIQFEQLFVNGAVQHLARYPNFNKDEILGGYASDAIASHRVKTWKIRRADTYTD